MAEAADIVQPGLMSEQILPVQVGLRQQQEVAGAGCWIPVQEVTASKEFDHKKIASFKDFLKLQGSGPIAIVSMVHEAVGVGGRN